MTRELVIVGQAARSLPHPPDADVWVVNGPRAPERWDVLLQLHGTDHIRQVDKDGEIQALMARAMFEGRRLVMFDPPWPEAERYPLDVVLKALPPERPYLTSSFALAIAWAVLEGFERITLDGIQFFGSLDRWSPGEAWSVPCIEYHIGRAEAAGVEVVVPEGAGLFRFDEHVYGFTGPGAI